jgi:hypothetical protein
MLDVIPGGALTTTLDDYAQMAAERMRRRGVVPFLGAGVNLADRQSEASWRPGIDLPSGNELAESLATQFLYPPAEPRTDLMRVAQYVESRLGEVAIYDELRDVFASTYVPTLVHKVLARVPSALARKGIANPHLLIVTTNYDDAQEQAFDEVGAEYDVLWYMAHGEHRRQFMHLAPGESPVPIDEPGQSDLSVDRRSVILKIHGAVYRPSDRLDSFVVTEDDYIEYMSAQNLVNIVPVKLRETMVDANFLFLGYRLGDWNLRVFLHALWAKRDKTAKSWSVNMAHRDLDRLFWEKRSVDMIESPLSNYMTALRSALEQP